MRRDNVGYVLFFIICVCASILYVVTAETRAAYRVLYPQVIEPPAKAELVTGLCTFGDCPTGHKIPTRVIEIQTILKNNQINETVTTWDGFDEEVDVKNATTTGGYIGTMYIIGYTSEEGFYEGSATASGYGVRSGYCAMNDSQRRALGISYGDQIYVEGLGTYTVMDYGCGWDVVDIWVYSNAEAYSMTGYYEVYYV